MGPPALSQSVEHRETEKIKNDSNKVKYTLPEDDVLSLSMKTMLIMNYISIYTYLYANIIVL